MWILLELFIVGEVTDEEIRWHDKIDSPDDENGWTALHWACYYGQLKTSEKLLEFSANPNSLARNFISPLHLAAAFGHHEIVRLLMLKGALVNQMDINGNTALMYAAKNNFPHSTNEILSSPFVDLTLDNCNHKTAYHLAVENKAHLAQAVIENFILNILS